MHATDDALCVCVCVCVCCVRVGVHEQGLLGEITEARKHAKNMLKN
jgi:hypothetical protein